ncbi:Putative tRNA (guanine(37)-N(1))-methyltransferase, SAM-dependent methyltransferase TRM5/TYW2-type [Septoria linicola]|uniref:tRNA (guanine(37)-N1)-methyltransferase n=1 Tax=Septoria linicola TaxID=215465 RepID=A0A9Q9EF93_9PEZI|nr:putative tRNA (guanine(37)-N(1))-methyltransferase, SAM-dependent methyltransferase TRM5/TYW2-type [Septoria linicola]USW46968.1 Putative tRNA (guanine(37)-N(1))-methyltransferase, SAM-dependent methyltransferase TRM5/TYW2-type [Septoria linicola]
MADEEMWRPPANRLMRTLDRSFFQRTIELKAARVFDNKNIFSVRTALERSKDVLVKERLGSVHPDPGSALAQSGKKCILLRPESGLESTGTSNTTQQSIVSGPHSPKVAELVTQSMIDIIPFQLKLDYSYWTYHDIISAVLPEDEQGEIPSGFSQVGHVAHLNLRDEYLKYKTIIAEILMDKNPGVRTVINKIDDVGEESEYRTFQYEVLAGPDDMNVTISEENCIFKFDYSKVYWNSRLNTEHRRLVALFNEGEAVCDVMAGIGPFAVPAGKKKIFTWANDLNPDSYESMKDAISRNKVQDYVQPFNEDGKTFIPSAVARLADTVHNVEVLKRPSRKDPNAQPEVVKTLRQPLTFQHFVMNLPATAITFLPSFIGLYPEFLRKRLGADLKMPLVHVYCFSTKSDDNVKEGIEIAAEVSRQLGTTLKPGRIEDGDVAIYDVRDVAPKKRMFCASFRLPEEVAFREQTATS